MGNPRCSGIRLVSLSLMLVGLALVEAERLTDGDGIDWRKLAAIGALGAVEPGVKVSGLPGEGSSSLSAPVRKHSADVPEVADLLASDAILGASGHDAALGALSVPRGGGWSWTRPWQAWQKGEEVEVEVLEEERAPESVYEAVLPGLAAREPSNGEALTQALRENLEARRLKWFEGPQAGGEKKIQYFALLDEDGTRRAVLMRFPANEDRGPDEIRALQNVLRSMDKVEARGFLKVYAHSHSPASLKKKGTEEVVLMVEPFLMTAREYLKQADVPFRTRARIFFQVMLSSVHQMYSKAIAHTTDISLDSVLITGNMDGELDDDFDAPVGKAVLSPTIFLTSSRVCDFKKWLKRMVLLKGAPRGAQRPGDLLKWDVRVSGRFLKQLLVLPRSERNLNVAAFKAMGNAMLIGAYDEVGAAAYVPRSTKTAMFWEQMEHIRSLEFPVRQEYDPAPFGNAANMLGAGAKDDAE